MRIMSHGHRASPFESRRGPARRLCSASYTIATSLPKFASAPTAAPHWRTVPRAGVSRNRLATTQDDRLQRIEAPPAQPRLKQIPRAHMRRTSTRKEFTDEEKGASWRAPLNLSERVLDCRWKSVLHETIRPLVRAERRISHYVDSEVSCGRSPTFCAMHATTLATMVLHCVPPNSKRSRSAMSASRASDSRNKLLARK